MPRVTRGFKARRRRNKVLSLAKGFRGGKHRLFKTAAEAVDRALCYAYRDRRVKNASSANCGLRASMLLPNRMASATVA